MARLAAVCQTAIHRISMNKEIMTRIRLDANAAAAQVWGVLTDFAPCLRTIPADATEN